MSLVELLRDADDIDIHGVAEAFERPRRSDQSRVVLKGDEDGAACVRRRGRCRPRRGRGASALVGELNPPINVEEGLKVIGARAEPTRRRRPS